MSRLHLQPPSQAPFLSSSPSPSPSSSTSSRFSFLKLFTNNTFSPSTNSLPFKPLTIRCRQSDVFETGTTPSSNPQNFSVGAFPPRVYVGHSIYKGKAALTITPRPPEFFPLDSGAYKISKDGYLLLQFAPSFGPRQYDWNRKQVFSLSVDEMGSVISLGARDSCEFFHDPFKGKRDWPVGEGLGPKSVFLSRSLVRIPLRADNPCGVGPVQTKICSGFRWASASGRDEGKIRKVLKIDPFQDASGFFFNLSVQNKLVNLDESITLPVTKAELSVLRAIFKFIMPYLLGWHTFADSINPEYSVAAASVANNAKPKYGGDYEWNR